jgi:ABC-type transport system substrate-binding protein
VALVKSDLEKVGIQVDVKMMRWKTFRDLRGKGHYQMTMGGWISGTLDPDGILYALFHSRYARKENSLNLARIKNAGIDKLLESGRSTYNMPEREDAYQKAAMEIYKASPDVFVVHPVAAIVARNNVKNIFIHDSHWVPLHKVSIE